MQKKKKKDLAGFEAKKQNIYGYDDVHIHLALKFI